MDDRGHCDLRLNALAKKPTIKNKHFVSFFRDMMKEFGFLVGKLVQIL